MASSFRLVPRSTGIYGPKTELATCLLRLSRAAKARNDLAEAEHFATLAFEATRAISVLPEVKK